MHSLGCLGCLKFFVSSNETAKEAQKSFSGKSQGFRQVAMHSPPLRYSVLFPLGDVFSVFESIPVK